MKKLFLLIVATSLATMSFAQSSLLATLNHEGKISTFYGAKAWKNAHKAAVNGDVITLSSGNFVSVDITKAITVRGAGMGIDSTAVSEPTIISGNFTINIENADSCRLIMEGIYSNHMIYYENVVNPLFLKCRLKTVKYNYNSSNVLKDASFIHCRIAEQLYLHSNCSASCVNSVIMAPSCNSSTTSNFEFQNCCLTGNVYGIYSSSLKNCIIVRSNNDSGSPQLSSSCTAFNCISVNINNYFNDITNSTNKSVSDFSTVFKTYLGEDLEKLDSESFQLTDVAKTQFLGMDGTEVGIYGGNLPFDSTPSNPQITKCNVAAKSTADGKLSVDIEVNAAK